MPIYKSFTFKLIITVLFVLSCQSKRNFSRVELIYIGELLFNHECSGNYECLTSWNEGEEFASLGIGHFIWYPAGEKVVYEESFPNLIKFLSVNNINIPQWIFKNNNIHMPWRDRNEFINEFNSRRMKELRKFLFKTMDYQVLFMVRRLESALPKILNNTHFNKRHLVNKQFYRMYNSQYGVYTLIDYINFKGEGVLDTESYGGYGWGLRQVLENMEDSGEGKEITDFVESARFVLLRRVINSPVNRNEVRWLQGWLRRINSYENLDTRLNNKSK